MSKRGICDKMLGDGMPLAALVYKASREGEWGCGCSMAGKAAGGGRAGT